MSLTAYLPLLRQTLLFRNMTDPEILTVLETMSPRRQHFPKRAIVVQDGSPMSEIGIVLSGSLHLFHIDGNGNSNLMDTCSTPSDATAFIFPPPPWKNPSCSFSP